MDIVLNQQLKLGIHIPIEEYLVSINEQIGFALEQISEKKKVGTSLWKSAKYIDRVIQDIGQINEMRKGLPSLFSEKTQKNINNVKEVSDKLLKIKKGIEDYYGLSPEEQTTSAEKIGEGYPFSTNSINDFRKGLLEFSVEINTQIRQGLPQDYNTSPSTLE
jgi:CRISPR/Cas system-associated protein Csx1